MPRIFADPSRRSGGLFGLMSVDGGFDLFEEVIPSRRFSSVFSASSATLSALSEAFSASSLSTRSTSPTKNATSSGDKPPRSRDRSQSDHLSMGRSFQQGLRNRRRATRSRVPRELLPSVVDHRGVGEAG